MRLPDLFRTSVFRLTAFFAVSSAAISLVLFAFIYWQTAVYETERVSRILKQEAQALESESPADVERAVQTRLATDFHRVTFAAIFDQQGRPIAGNLPSLPDGLPRDGIVHSINVDRNDDGQAAFENILAIASRLPDHDTLVIGRSIDELRNLRSIVIRSLLLGVIPALAMAFAVGGLLSQRTQRRIVGANAVIDRIMHGNLDERLPVRQGADDFDRISLSINRMLDEIERMVRQIKGVTDSIAHDLRTPLTRMHTRLERTRIEGHAPGDIDEVVDRALGDLDLTLGIITALLRIAEIEDGQRRSAFTIVDLATVVHTVTELYEPIAEEKNLKLEIDASAVPPVRGDYELLIEAVANLVDNAIKFTPPYGLVRIALSQPEPGRVTLRVADTGPGIPENERRAVFQRFYRARQALPFRGHGLGLSLVQAIADLHGFTINISDGRPGAVFDMACQAISRQSAA